MPSLSEVGRRPGPESARELLRGTVHCESRAHLEARLRAGDRLRIKFGIDPSAPDLHLGHTVPMRLLRRWQLAGHLPVLIIGDYTARIGDPSGKSAARPQLDDQTVEANARSYLDQLFLLVDRDQVEVRRQSEWYGSFDLADVLRLTRTATVAQLLQRADFEQRMRAEQAVGVHELLYPLLQGYDSVAVRSDVELGGTDQLFNLLRGRDVQEAFGCPQQDIVTVPLLEGLDGEKKMSKSLGNAVAVISSATEQFGQLMSIPDSLILRYLELLTDAGPEVVAELRQGMEQGANPRDAKAEMAGRVVAQFHGAEDARVAADEFLRVHRQGELPAQISEVAADPAGRGDPRDLLVSSGLATSRGEAARLIRGGAVRLDDRVVTDWREKVSYRSGSVLRVGSRRAVRLIWS